MIQPTTFRWVAMTLLILVQSDDLTHDLPMDSWIAQMLLNRNNRSTVSTMDRTDFAKPDQSINPSDARSHRRSLTQCNLVISDLGSTQVLGDVSLGLRRKIRPSTLAAEQQSSMQTLVTRPSGYYRHCCHPCPSTNLIAVGSVVYCSTPWCVLPWCVLLWASPRAPA